MDSRYPVTLEGRLDEPLSRWLWLVKWLVLIPHVIVLAFLWVGVVFAWLGALTAILFTGRYPRALFNYNLGVLRWSWRVGFYGYSALGTDHYPPFTLAAVDDYPATFDVEYPEQLSRGLALVKWWLLAIPHYLIVGVLLGGFDLTGGSGLVGILVLISGMFLLIGRRYPGDLFNLIIGCNRWAARVGAYALLMRDEYPPFRLDTGPHETHARPAGAIGQATS